VSALAWHYGLARVEVPPLEVTVTSARTAQGDRFYVVAADARGVLQPLFRDDFGQSTRFISAECARRAVKATGQMTVIYRGDIECNF